METFRYYAHQKITIWEEKQIDVEAKSKEEADKKLIEYFRKYGVDNINEDIFENISSTSSYPLLETEEYTTVDENSGNPTVEIFNEDRKTLLICNLEEAVTVPKWKADLMINLMNADGGNGFTDKEIAEADQFIKENNYINIVDSYDVDGENVNLIFIKKHP